MLPGQAGQIEAVLTIPEKARSNYAALLGHPHSLQGGSMDNKVVTTLARVFREFRIPSLRFNFRGVGASAGEYDAGGGEGEDMLSIAHLWQQEKPDTQFLFAGFSFGSYVAYRAAAQHEHKLLITIAPPVHHYDYTEFSIFPEPWIIVQGDEDEVVPVALVEAFKDEAPVPVSWLHFENTGHFFHGKLVELKKRLVDTIQEQVPIT